jgi:hypothetical protein
VCGGAAGWSDATENGGVPLHHATLGQALCGMDRQRLLSFCFLWRGWRVVGKPAQSGIIDDGRAAAYVDPRPFLMKMAIRSVPWARDCQAP